MKTNLKQQQAHQWLFGKGWQERWITKEHKETLGRMPMFIILIAVMVSQVYICVKTYRTLNFKYVQFIVCQLCFSKVVHEKDNRALWKRPYQYSDFTKILPKYTNMGSTTKLANRWDSATWWITGVPKYRFPSALRKLPEGATPDPTPLATGSPLHLLHLHPFL